MKIEWIDSVESTNSHIRARRNQIEPMTMIIAREQTAGRGQRGNSWESEPDRNLTFSFLFKPVSLPALCQFSLSEAVSLAIVDTLGRYGVEASVKWPNDIYAGDRKICGILIENSILGSGITDSIVGIGLNVNQQSFVSGAPNPVSMKNITRMDYALEEVARSVGESLEEHLSMLSESHKLHEKYLSLLWRGDGKEYPFKDRLTGEEFKGVIKGVMPSGHIVLDRGGEERLYAFKEVEFLLSHLN